MYAKKYFNKNLATLKIGTPRQVIFAASHLKNTDSSLKYVKLRDYHMIPATTLMSFPQDPKGPFANGCLLLSILACHIARMALYSIEKKKLWCRRLARWKRFSKFKMPDDFLQQTQQTQEHAAKFKKLN